MTRPPRIPPTIPPIAPADNAPELGGVEFEIEETVSCAPLFEAVVLVATGVSVPYPDVSLTQLISGEYRIDRNNNKFT